MACILTSPSSPSEAFSLFLGMYVWGVGWAACLFNTLEEEEEEDEEEEGEEGEEGEEVVVTCSSRSSSGLASRNRLVL